MPNEYPQPVPQEMPERAAEPAALAEYEARLASLEDRLAQEQLTQEGKARDLLIKEIEQRITNRQTAISIAVVVMIFMAMLLGHVTHSFYWGRLIVVPQSVAIAMFLAPVISITTLAVVLIVGAFRHFKDRDLSNVSLGSLAAEAARNSMT
ncbi:hypothetical protein [Aquamicrobium zhengzhouense]|uniref:Holin-X, holin superfamily III n=1 Tax=Aquamicrobium zhengzhouense TaxID=2781738 RepID=A0ABS0SAK5_9HYPH|nr:hypothetical protein [Aquamicrobium zhengzhouense]MBI1620325.1 hypothetical protein [Aquamicrobium zhengzhouense]